MFFKKTCFLIYLSAAVVTASVSGCGSNTSKISRPLLGTIVSITISGGPENAAEDFDAAFKEIENVQTAFNLYNPESEISRINKSAARHPVKVNNEVFTLIQRSLEVSVKTGGAFDITFASTGKLWDFSQENFTPPDDKTVKKLLPLISYKNVRLDSNASTVQFLKSGTKIGLGGIAKGYATGRAISALKKRDIKNAIVACAGDIQVIGNNNGKPWMTGIQDPRGKGVIGAIEMQDGESVSTSGDYERFRIVNGRRYHHIINPATGYPADSGLISVTVFSSDPVLSDVYSTAFFVSGLEKTRKLLQTMNGLSVVLVTADMKVYTSAGLKGRIVFRNDLEVIYF
ncbi:MAG TPA: FAD:protein FMN transferase [Spirochaetota bacterium]|nr:FAD:protein FMN transferase [Spirochaetota bacterium]